MQILKKFSRSLLLLCAALFLMNASALAQGKNFSISTTLPSWIVPVDPSAPQPKGNDISDGWYVSLLERQNHAELKTTYVHVIRHLISNSGVQNASEVSVTYDPSFQKLLFHQLRVWRNGKVTDRLKEAQFKVIQNEKELSKFIYSGTFDAYVILDDIRKGDRIEYAYSVAGTNPIFGDKVADDFYLESGSTYGKRYMNLIARNDRKLDFKNYNHNVAPKINNRGDLKIYAWENKLTATYKTADHKPTWYNPLKHTQISEYHSWAEVVNWGLSVNAYPGLKTPLLDQKANELLKQAKNDTEAYMVLAIRFVQDEIRYMGIEMGENSQKPNSPEKILKQRYGDCKDKALLLCYFLKKVNVPAYMAYVDTEAGNKTSEFLPSPFLFNHVVVMIEYKGEKTWIDATMSNQRGGFGNIYFPNYGQALVLKPGNTKPENVISIPTGGLSAYMYFTLTDTLAEHTSKLKIESKYSDQYADNIRQLIADDGIEALEKSYLDYIKGYYPDLIADGHIKITDDEAENKINITENYLIPNIWQKLKEDNGRKYAYFQGDLISSELRTAKAKARVEPFKMKYPVNVEQRIFIRMPFALHGANDRQKIENDNYYFEFNSIHRGAELQLHYSYRTFKESIDGADLVQYAKDQEKIEESLNYNINWTGGMSGAESTITSLMTLKPINWYIVALAMGIAIISGIYFSRKFVKRNAFDITELMHAKGINGWLILIMISIILAPCAMIYSAVESGIFNELPKAKVHGFFVTLAIAGHAIIAIGYGIVISWSVHVLIMFFSRRKELPASYIAYLKTTILLCVLEGLVRTLLYYKFGSRSSLRWMDFFSVLWDVSFSVIFILYMKRSQRVRETFVFTYPAFIWRTQLIQHTNKLITKKFSKIDDVSEPLPLPGKPDQPEETDERE